MTGTGSPATTQPADGFEPPRFSERFNMADYFLDARLREGRGERVAIREGTRAITYAEVWDRANRAGDALRVRGIDLEDRVLLVLPDGVAFVEAWFGVLKAGGVFCMANPHLDTDALDYLVGYTKARAVVVHRDALPAIGPALDRHPRCRVRLAAGLAPGDPTPPGFERWEIALDAARPDQGNADTSRDDLAGWLFTSGTTGRPKGAVHFHHDFPFHTECYAKGILGLREDDVFVSVSRLFFGYATGTNLMFPFAIGGTAVLFPDKPTPGRMFEEVARHGATVLTNVPSMIRQMLDAPEAAEADMGSVRMCLSAGEALPPSLYERWRGRWPRAELLDGIGSAEMFHIYIGNRPGRVRPGSLGELVPGYEARIVGPDGGEAAPGEPGRLWVKGDSSALCYWGDPEKSATTFVGEWVVTADLFTRDRDGYFWYAGRGDDLLKVRGKFVSPLEIEDCLARHPGVRECAVVGVEDGDGLTVPKAFVVRAEPVAARSGDGPSDGTPNEALAEELQAWVRERLEPNKAPRRVAFVDALPRNDRGKVMRRALR